MCIVLLTTAHPGYALIAIDNRDEFILRPTSRPHWWTHQPSGANVLSPRDLQRAEKGTWLGITETGHFAVLTNYRETDPADANHPVHAQRSRGGMVTAWLGADPNESVSDSVHQLVRDDGVRGVGGFSMVAGKLRKKRRTQNGSTSNGAPPEAATNGNGVNGTHQNGVGKDDRALEPIAIISNRCGDVQDVPWICDGRGQVHGLSNTTFDSTDQWPKVVDGKRLVSETIEEAVNKGLSEDQLAERLFAVLDRDTLPPPASPETGFAEYILELKKSIFIPPIGDESHKAEMDLAAANGKGEFKWNVDDIKAAEQLARPDAPSGQNGGIGFETGLYGTQRQTVVMVDWDGNVTYRERALWDSNGNVIQRGEGDVSFRFKIKGWDEDEAKAETEKGRI